MRWKIGAIGVLLLMTTAAVQVAGLDSDLDVAEPTITTDSGVADGPADAEMSTVEDTTSSFGVCYQEDAGIPCDAPATCADLDRSRVVHDDGVPVFGQLVELDDEADSYLTATPLHFANNDVVTLRILNDLPTEVQTLGFDVLTADCSASIFDEDSSYYGSISPEPGEGEKKVYADWDARPCVVSKDYWKFHVSDGAPSEIFIEWTNGDWERTSFIDSNEGEGNYITYANTAFDIRHAEVIVPEEWDGKFELIQRPCDTVDGGAGPVFRGPDPDRTFKDEDGLYAEWQVNAEEFVLLIYLKEGIVGSLGDPAMSGATAVQTDRDSADGPADAMRPCHRTCASTSGFEMLLE